MPIQFEIDGVLFHAEPKPMRCVQCVKIEIEALHSEIPDLLFMHDGKVHVNWAHFKALHDAQPFNDNDSQQIEDRYEKLIDLVKAAVGVIQFQTEGGYSPWAPGVMTPMTLTWRWGSWQFLYPFVKKYHCQEYIDQVLADKVIGLHKHKWGIRFDRKP